MSRLCQEIADLGMKKETRLHQDELQLINNIQNTLRSTHEGVRERRECILNFLFQRGNNQRFLLCVSFEMGERQGKMRRGPDVGGIRDHLIIIGGFTCHCGIKRQKRQRQPHSETALPPNRMLLSESFTLRYFHYARHLCLLRVELLKAGKWKALLTLGRGSSTGAVVRSRPELTEPTPAKRTRLPLFASATPRTSARSRRPTPSAPCLGSATRWPTCRSARPEPPRRSSWSKRSPVSTTRSRCSRCAPGVA